MRRLATFHILVLSFIFSVMPSMGWHASTAASADAAPVTCDSLTTGLSDDKNFYILTATASGPADSITGYSFDYGDRESYHVTFGSRTDSDRHTASVTHTYKTPGAHKVIVHVNVSIHGKSGSVSSDACKTTVAILPPNTTLPNTGSNFITILVLCGAIGLLAGLLHALWQRRSVRL